jgi:hypothetical protein
VQAHDTLPAGVVRIDTAIPMKPPPQIDGADVLEWAWSEAPFGYVRFDSGSPAAAIHGLALCRYRGSEGVYRFSCNASWEVEQDACYPSLDAAKALLPEQYRLVAASWSKV